jgi:hypothetical protein
MYVDNILIIHNSHDTEISNTLKDLNFYSKLKFTIKNENNNKPNCLEPTLVIHTRYSEFHIYRNQTFIDVIIHNSCHSLSTKRPLKIV